MQFLDSEPSLTSEVYIQRPWKTFWPAQPGDGLYEWLCLECPDAISWQFDPSQPFDRPWQKWTRSIRTRDPGCPTVVLSPKSLSSIDDDLHRKGVLPTFAAPAYWTQWIILVLMFRVGKTNPLNESKKSDAAVSSPSEVQEIIKSIDEMDLRKVIPKEFNYLAPLDLYDSEKPYHSRLPFLNGLKRTNIVAQSYDSVVIHDINGMEEFFRLDCSGFQFQRIPPDKLSDLTNESVQQEYLPFLESWLKNQYSCTKILIYTYNVSISCPKNQPQTQNY